MRCLGCRPRAARHRSRAGQARRKIDAPHPRACSRPRSIPHSITTPLPLPIFSVRKARCRVGLQREILWAFSVQNFREIFRPQRQFSRNRGPQLLDPRAKHVLHEFIHFAVWQVLGSAHDQIMRGAILDLRDLVGSDALVLKVPLAHELPDVPLHELRQIPVDEAGVLSSELYLSRK